MSLHLYADQPTMDAVQRPEPRVLLFGGYGGYANFGDILQLKGAIRWHREHTRLTPVLLCEADAITHGEFAEKIREWFNVQSVVFWSNDRLDPAPPQMAELTVAPPITHLHVYGGGFLNALWGTHLIPAIEELHRRFGVGHYALTGQQIDPPLAPVLKKHFATFHPVIAGGRDPQSASILADCGVPSAYSFDDAAESIQELATALQAGQTNSPPPDLLIHMNLSPYSIDAGCDDPTSDLASQLALVRRHLDARSANPSAVVLQAYTDRRDHQVRDSLAVIQQLEDLFPFPSYRVLDLANAALHLGRQQLDRLNVDASQTIAVTCSYHVSMLCAALGVPCYLQARNSYYQQKIKGLGSPAMSLQQFLDKPHCTSLTDQFAARAPWLEKLRDAYGVAPGSPAPAQATQTTPSPTRPWRPKDNRITWMAELERSKAWLSEQHAWLVAELSHRDKHIGELNAWIQALQQDKRWLDQQRHAAWARTDSLQAEIAEIQRRCWLCRLIGRSLERKRKERPAPVNKPLVMDFGLHHGLDTDFYLRKGFRVVAVEADPILADKARRQFAAAIASGDLIIENAGIAEKAGIATFYRNLDNDNWNSFVPKWATRNGSRYEEIEVECVLPQDIYQKHGMPYYLKIDIEGHDMIAIRGLRDFTNRPRFVSVEENQATHFSELWASGCRRFKLINQRQLWTVKCPQPAREGEYVDITFTGEHSGPFGEETPGPWLSFADAMEQYLTQVRSPSKGYLAGDDWFDIHAVFD